MATKSSKKEPKKKAGKPKQGKAGNVAKKPSSGKYKSKSAPERLEINTERDLRANIRAINQRFNADQDLARMLLVNPILALEDAGIQLTPEMKEHVMNALRFPPNVIERRDQLELELYDELKALEVPYSVPLTEEQRADLIFGVLKLKMPEIKEGRRPKRSAPERSAIPGVRSKEIRLLAKQHSLVAKLVEYERMRQGRLVFYPRDVYERYKSGLKRQNWIQSVKFKV